MHTPSPRKHTVDEEALWILRETRAERHDPHNPALDLPSARTANEAAPHDVVRHLAHALLHGASVVLPAVSAGRVAVAVGEPASPYAILDLRGDVLAPMPDAFDAALYLAQRHGLDARAWLERQGVLRPLTPSPDALRAVEAAAMHPNLAGLVRALEAHFAVRPSVMLAGRHVPANVAAPEHGCGVVWVGRARFTWSQASGLWVIFTAQGLRTEYAPADFARELCALCLHLEEKP